MHACRPRCGAAEAQRCMKEVRPAARARPLSLLSSLFSRGQPVRPSQAALQRLFAAEAAPFRAGPPFRAGVVSVRCVPPGRSDPADEMPLCCRRALLNTGCRENCRACRQGSADLMGTKKALLTDKPRGAPADALRRLRTLRSAIAERRHPRFADQRLSVFVSTCSSVLTASAAAASCGRPG